MVHAVSAQNWSWASEFAYPPALSGPMFVVAVTYAYMGSGAPVTGASYEWPRRFVHPEVMKRVEARAQVA